jgi:hypothetical protein
MNCPVCTFGNIAACCLCAGLRCLLGLVLGVVGTMTVGLCASLASLCHILRLGVSFADAARHSRLLVENFYVLDNIAGLDGLIHPRSLLFGFRLVLYIPCSCLLLTGGT